VKSQEVPEATGDWAADVRGAYSRLRTQMHGV
jgi:hypothetical protein